MIGAQSNLKKETPSLNNIFAKKDTTEKEAIKEEVHQVDGVAPELTKDQVAQAIKSYVEENKSSSAVKIVLSKDFEWLDGTTMRFPITNTVEIAMIQPVELDILGYLRRKLQHGGIQISYQVKEVSSTDNPYTPSEIFASMAKKNPALLKLKDDLGLDTDY